MKSRAMLRIIAQLDAELITSGRYALLVIYGDKWVIFVRIDTGLCKRFTYTELGF